MKIKEKIYIPVPMHRIWDFFDKEKVKTWWPHGGEIFNGNRDSGYINTVDRGRNISLCWKVSQWETTVDFNTYPEPAGTILEVIHTGWEQIPEVERKELMSYSEKYWHVLLMELKKTAEGRRLA